MRELSDLIPELDAPPGGLVRLRARLDRPRSRRWPVVVALAAAVVLVVSWPRPKPAELPDDPVLRALVGAPGAAHVGGPEVVAMRVPASRDVLYFRVASLAPPADERR